MSGQLIVRRPAQYADLARRYRIHVDGQLVGDVDRGATRTFDLPAGEHEVVARVDWCRSNRLAVVIRDGAPTEVEVGSNLIGLRKLAAVYFITFGFASYLYLRHRPRGFEVVVES